MGSLSDLQIPSDEVIIPGSETTLTVRGLSLPDCINLFRRHGEALEIVYEQNIVAQDDLPLPIEIAKAILLAVPDSVAEIIALSNGQPGEVETVRRLSAPIQLDALAKIAALTFHSEADVKKLVETITGGANLVTRLVNILTSPAH